MASLTERMIGAAMLNVATYEEVEADQTATSQAAMVVALVAVAGAIGNYFRHGGRGIIGAVIGAFIGWLLWAAITYFIGTRLFGGTATIGELLRTLGFAQSPGVIGILAIIPILGWLIMVVIALWQLVAGIIAIRQALDFTTGKAILTALIGWVVVWILTAVLFAGLFGGSLMGR
jgi:hypothetical protein